MSTKQNNHFLSNVSNSDNAIKLYEKCVSGESLNVIRNVLPITYIQQLMSFTNIVPENHADIITNIITVLLKNYKDSVESEKIATYCFV